jgi:hypothetical protein
MKQKRKGKMDKQTYTQTGTYGQSDYNPSQSNTWVIPSGGENKFVFEGGKSYKPTMLLLKSYIQATEDRKNGLASPVFSSVEEMKKWFDEHE